MAICFSPCQPCSYKDPTSNTVTIDPSNLPGLDDKENHSPDQKTNEEGCDSLAAQCRSDLVREEQLRRERMEAEQAAAVAAAAEAAETEAEETRRQQAVAEVNRRRAQLEAEERQGAEDEEIQRAINASLEEERAFEKRKKHEAEAEAARQREREAQEVEARRLAAELEAARAKVDVFLKSNGFADVNTKKKSMMGGTKFPLHMAVGKNDAEMVAALIACGADVEVKNSAGKRPLDIAEKSNSNGSQADIVTALQQASLLRIHN